MAKILYVYANPKPVEKSITLTLGKEFFDEYKKLNPNDEIIERNLYKEDIPRLDIDVLNGWEKMSKGIELSHLEQEKIDLFNSFAEEFKNADKVVIGAPMWNMGYPAVLKSYLETICISGKTFIYTEDKGLVGLVKDKPVLHIQSRGDVFPHPFLEEHCESFLKTVMRFVGITSFSTLICQGVDIDPSKRQSIIDEYKIKASKMARTF